MAIIIQNLTLHRSFIVSWLEKTPFVQSYILLLHGTTYRLISLSRKILDMKSIEIQRLIRLSRLQKCGDIPSSKDNGELVYEVSENMENWPLPIPSQNPSKLWRHIRGWCWYHLNARASQKWCCNISPQVPSCREFLPSDTSANRWNALINQA